MKHKIILIILLITLIFGCKTPTEEQTGITLNPELSLIDELTVDVLKINSFEFYYDNLKIYLMITCTLRR